MDIYLRLNVYLKALVGRQFPETGLADNDWLRLNDVAIWVQTNKVNVNNMDYGR